MRCNPQGNWVKLLGVLIVVNIVMVLKPVSSPSEHSLINYQCTTYRPSVTTSPQQTTAVIGPYTYQPHLSSISQYNLSTVDRGRRSDKRARSEPPHVGHVDDLMNEASEIKSVLARQRDACEAERREGQCPCLPPSLKGKMELNVNMTVNYTWQDVSEFAGVPELDPGGTWEPPDCQALRRLLIIVPCRDRESHLKAFLAHMHPVLQRQQLAYRILVVEQRQPRVFNKAATMNAGFAEAISRDWAFDCVVLHDVDLLMEDDRNLLTCGNKVMHYGMFIDKFGYKIIGGVLFGGIVAMTKEQFVNINGYTNRFFGWGGEDDNAYKRVVGKNLAIARPSVLVGKYSSLRHPRDETNPKIRRPASVLWNTTYEEGLSTVSYDVISLLLQPSFTHIIVDLNITDLPYPWANSRETAHYFSKLPNTTCLMTDIVGTMNYTGDNFLNRCMDMCSLDSRCLAISVGHVVGSACRMMASPCKRKQESQTPDTTVFLKAVDLDLKELRLYYEVYISDCFGNDIESTETSNSYKCALKCEEMQTCGGFVVSKGRCFIKSLCIPPTVTHQDQVLRSYVRKRTSTSDRH